MSDGMKIIGLEVQNFKRLRAVSLKLDGNNLILGGQNESGKSSVLDAMWVGLGGPDVMKDLRISEPIRKGAETASITLDLGDLIVTRNWTANDKSYLKVSTKDGANYSSPQGMLNALLGKLFDPFDFSRMSAAGQREILLGIVSIGIDLNSWESQRKEVYDQRTEVNREVTRLENTLKSMDSCEDAPAVEISASTVIGEMEAAQAVKDANDAKRRELDNLKMNCSRLFADCSDVDGEIKKCEERLASLKSLLSEKQTAFKGMKDQFESLNVEVLDLKDPDMSVFSSRLSEVESTNRKVQSKRQYLQISKQRDERKAESDELTETLALMDKTKANAIKEAHFPIEGLAFDDSGITYRDIPFGQCSSEERLRVAMAIAMAMNPRLKVIRISDGSLLDEKNFALIQEMAAEQGYQLLVEKVGDPGEMGVIIEDGAVRGSEASE